MRTRWHVSCYISLQCFTVSPFLFILFNKEKIESNAKKNKRTQKMKPKKWKRDKKRWNNYWVLVSKTGDSGSWWRQAPGHPQWPSSPCRCCAWQPPLRWLTCWLELAVENQVTKSSYKLAEPKWVRNISLLFMLKFDLTTLMVLLNVFERLWKLKFLQ